jgi:hypothetical protein
VIFVPAKGELAYALVRKFDEDGPMIGEASFGFAVGPEHVYGDECFGEIRDAPNVLDQHSTFATMSVGGDHG